MPLLVGVWREGGPRHFRDRSERNVCHLFQRKGCIMTNETGGQALARVLAAIEGFFVTYGVWPSQVRLTPGYIAHLHDQGLSADAYSKLTARVALVPDPSATVVAEDKNGRSYNYGASGFPKSKPAIRAREWLCLGDLNRC